ncbi:MAG TPA: DUF2474 domain-containing protein [Erythrobacter sp.]|nr:DUF2474 domain-containing protein [Erythrobacter sp.]
MTREPSKPLAQRLGWFVLIWALSVAVIGAVGWLIRSVLL